MAAAPGFSTAAPQAAVKLKTICNTRQARPDVIPVGACFFVCGRRGPVGVGLGGPLPDSAELRFQQYKQKNRNMHVKIYIKW